MELRRHANTRVVKRRRVSATRVEHEVCRAVLTMNPHANLTMGMPYTARDITLASTMALALLRQVDVSSRQLVKTAEF